MEPLNKASYDFYDDDHVDYNEHIAFMKDYLRNLLKAKKFPIKCRILYEAEVKQAIPIPGEINTKKVMFPKYNKNLLREIQNESEIDDYLNKVFEEISVNLEEYNQHGTGWIFNKSIATYMKTAVIRRRGASYRELPDLVNNKKCCINVKNEDMKCFLWAILSGLHQIPSKEHPERLTKYKEFENTLNMDGIEYPVCCKNYDKFEKQNKQPINVYELYKEDGVIAPIYTSKIDIKNAINIGLYKDHYVWIKSMSKLVRNECHAQKGDLCPKCLERSVNPNHLEECMKSTTERLEMPN